MLYQSTRSKDRVTSAQAIVRGIAPDGGLYAPEALPSFSWDEILKLADMPYPQRAAHVLAALLPDFPEEELRRSAEKAYARFDGDSPAPLKKLGNTRVLELFHGPTMAFKDMALQMLPHLMRLAARKTGEERDIAILTATSGDTGKAALEGFADVEGTSVTVFYPLGGVSAIQEKQMVTSRGKNTHVIAVRGNFDDAQSGVKKLFTDPEFIEAMAASGKVLSSANSINLGRLAPQAAYYFSAAAQMMREGAVGRGKELDVCVPTGNFGNILAAWYAKRMGAPIGKLICASNANDVLTEFFLTGVYDRRREFKKTISPSMDILISSNLERLLFEIGGLEKNTAWMDALKKDGVFRLDRSEHEQLRAHFLCGSADDRETAEEIARMWREERYVMDPHTAVASAVLRKLRTEGKTKNPVLLVSTASPYKFAPDVCTALGIDVPDDPFAASEALCAATGLPIPAPMRELREAPVRHTRVCGKDEMGQAVLAEMGQAGDKGTGNGQ